MAESLERLNLTYVDLFLIHFPVDQTIQPPFRFDHVETWKEMEKLLKPGGPTRFIGVSNMSPKQMEEILAAATIKPAIHQIEMHPYLQQTSFVEWHRKNNVSLIGYAPLGNTSPYYEPAQKENPTNPPIMTANPTLMAIGQERGCSAAQVALAWNVKRGVAVIPKAAKVEHQTENIQAEKCAAKLTGEDMKKITDISKQYSGRFNNPCKNMKMPCYEGLDHTDQGR
jgi:alcohol dehydrogenase (NADP+)